MVRQTDTDRQTGRQTDRQTEKQITRLKYLKRLNNCEITYHACLFVQREEFNVIRTGIEKFKLDKRIRPRTRIEHTDLHTHVPDERSTRLPFCYAERQLLEVALTFH